MYIKDMFPMMLVLSHACTLAAHPYYSMQLPPIHLLFALPYVVTCWSVPYLCTFYRYYGLGYVRPPLIFWAHGSLLHCHFVLICGLNKHPAATLAPLSVRVLSSQYLFQRGPIWMKYERLYYYWNEMLGIKLRFVKGSPLPPVFSGLGYILEGYIAWKFFWWGIYYLSLQNYPFDMVKSLGGKNIE